MKHFFYLLMLCCLLAGCIHVKVTDSDGSVRYYEPLSGGRGPYPLTESDISERIENNSSLYNNSRTVHFLKNGTYLLIDEYKGQRKAGHWWVKTLRRKNGNRFGALCLGNMKEKWNDHAARKCMYLVPDGPEVVIAATINCFTEKTTDIECSEALVWDGNYAFIPRENDGKK